MLTTAHVPGDSPLHRAPAGAKLLVLGAGLLALGVVRTPVTVGVGAALTALAAVVSGIGPRRVWEQLRPALLVSLLVGALQLWLSDALTAGITVGWLLVAVLAAGLVTATTPMQDLLDAVVVGVRPLARFGIDPERVALTLGLAVRSVPVVAQLSRDVREARMARGAERSLRALAVPLVIRTVRYADRLGEALAARGVDDD